MSKIHYFQRYSSIENTVTNNTLQLLARIYAYSAEKASQLLTELTGEPVDIGIEINQQESGQGSVPDGAVIQRSFKVLIEAKVDASPDIDQLLRHSDSFSSEEQKILLLLTRQAIGGLESEIRNRIAERHPNVIFKSITYEEICNLVKSLFQEYEYNIRTLAEDYVEYCNDVGLFDQSRYLLRIVPCGQSIGVNSRYGIYFQPSDRGYTQHNFVGIYKDKAVQYVWRIDCVFDVEYAGDLKKVLIQGRDTNEYDDKIVSIIEDAKAECGYEISGGHRFFCGIPVPTDYRKSSPGGIQGARFINLREVVGEETDVTAIAEQLRGKEWA